MEYRIEHDSMGEMKVPADRLWAAQTERRPRRCPAGMRIPRPRVQKDMQKAADGPPASEGVEWAFAHFFLFFSSFG